MLTLASLIVTFAAARNVLAVGSPFGFASGTTGGAGAAQAIPTSAAQLKSWLEDDVTRNILLDRTYDFTDTEGTLSGPGCKPWSCSPNPQLAINANNWCSSSYPTVTATYKAAGTSGIRVKSNKTILGKGTSGWIKGKGLRLNGVSNVIIQNIRISDINPQYVWGGDALYIDNSSKVWVKHHYWAFLFAGNGDQITFARNYVYFTAGRGPHVGGTAGYSLTLHMFNNYFNDITGHAIDADTGSRILVEGNYFNRDTIHREPKWRGLCANLFFYELPMLWNAKQELRIEHPSVVKSASIMDPGSVPSYVLANAGLGKVN
ncbi:unnamed protein product [Rhizoctonia solani]|uniref:pectin lyase n=1 Tax=Rhizoctonia solani TaxID=456999 RepID=A0A8H3AVB4_9AGAM|nr:unnamed protein product [Rhizoctonia solani]